MVDSDIHVLPIDDLLPHEDVGTGCICDPEIEVYGADLIIIHNSFDGREEKEMASVTEYWQDPRENVFDLAEHYHECCQPEFYTDLHHVSEYLVGIFERFIPKGSTVLEIGANCGRNLHHLRESGYLVFGVEINPRAIALNEWGVDILEGSLEDMLPVIQTDSYACVLSQSVMMHLPPESEVVFDHMARIAREYLVINEVENRNDAIVWKRNYGEVFRKLGFEQIHSQHPDCGSIDHGITRVFKKYVIGGVY